MSSSAPTAQATEQRVGGRLTRLSAFTRDGVGGNPAGVWIGEQLPDVKTMQAIAAELGYSETAFVEPASGTQRTVRYFSPAHEVPFCGHATIATAVQLGESDGGDHYQLDTQAGQIAVTIEIRDGERYATLTSVEPAQKPLPPTLLDDALALLSWSPEDLDPAIPPALAYAGAWHLVLATASRSRLAQLDYNFDALRDLMQEHGLTTLQLIQRETSTRFNARNPFAIGGVVEDPATGAAAAALGGYLRDAKLIESPFQIEIIQGEDMGSPSRLWVRAEASGGIAVSGAAAIIEG
ncbi:PhzF family phenazine biosynthesis protein [Gammaproteobacteria bacterium]|nr:PhzF family phenazine biosynthesis protein [Gammaproteobacteria bacterium]